MKTKHLFALLVALSMGVMIGCKTAVQVERPRESYVPSQPAVSTSEIPLGVDLDLKKLEIALNKKMNGVIFEGNDLANHDLKVKVSKVQNFTFSVKNNVIEYRVPLKIWSRFGWNFEKFGLKMSDSYEANGAIALNFRTTISLNRNWRLVSKTESTGYQWIETPKISVAGIDVPIKPIADLALKQTDKEITQQIDKALAEAVDLRSYVAQAWDMMQQPFEVSPEDHLWIRVSPKDIYLAPFTSKGDKLSLHLTLYAQIESLMGTKPSEVKKVALPEYKIVNRPPQQINLNLLTDVTFDKIAQIAKSQLVNQTFSQSGKKVTIKDLDIFGSEGKLFFEALLEGSVKGKVYFTGKLNFNSEKNAIEVLNPEFDINTKNVLVKSANWLLHGFLLKQLQPYLTYSLTKDLEDARNEANKSISNVELMKGIGLQGKLNTISVNELSLVPGAVRVKANAKGNIGIKIADIEF